MSQGNSDAERPLLSVALITYNHAGTVGAALDGILAQETPFPIEIVVGDDCSTDGTRDTLQEYSARHSGRLRLLLHQSNLHKTARRNLWTTLDACRGKYLAILEGDDYWTHPQKLRRQVEAMEADSEITACVHETMVLRNDRPMMPFQEHLPAGELSLDHLIRRGPPHTSSFVIRADILNRFPRKYLDLPMGDWPLMVHSAESGKVVALPDSKWSVYRIQGQGSWTTTSLLRRTHGEIRALECYLDRLPPDLHRQIRRQIARRRLWVAEGHLQAGHRAKAVCAFVPAAFLWTIYRPIGTKPLLRLAANMLLPRPNWR